MKRLITTACGIALMAVSSTGFTQGKLGVRAGLNLSSYTMDHKDSETETKTKNYTGFQVGAVYDMPMGDDLSIQTGLLFTQKGTEYDLEDAFDVGSNEEVEGYMRQRLNYLEVPISLAIKLNNFHFAAGPYLAFGLGGKYDMDVDYTYTIGNVSTKENFDDKGDMVAMSGEVKEDDLKDDENAYSALDYGFNLGVGFQSGKVLVNLTYGLGLGNIVPDADQTGFDRDDFKTTNKNMAVTISYFFND